MAYQMWFSNKRFRLTDLCWRVVEGGLSPRQHIVHQCRPEVGLVFPERPNLCGRLMEVSGTHCKCARPKRRGRLAWAGAGFAKGWYKWRMVGEFILLLVGAILSVDFSISKFRGKASLVLNIGHTKDCVYLVYHVGTSWTSVNEKQWNLTLHRKPNAAFC